MVWDRPFRYSGSKALKRSRARSSGPRDRSGGTRPPAVRPASAASAECPHFCVGVSAAIAKVEGLLTRSAGCSFWRRLGAAQARSSRSLRRAAHRTRAGGGAAAFAWRVA